MAPYRTTRVLAALPEPLYRSLVWLDVRLAMLFSVGLPLVLLIWASVRKEGSLVRLLGIYWKVASLLVITALLFTDGRPLGFLLAGLAQLLELFRLNRDYQDGLPRKLLIEAFNTVDDEDLVRQYRRKMASLLN